MKYIDYWPSIASHFEATGPSTKVYRMVFAMVFPTYVMSPQSSYYNLRERQLSVLFQVWFLDGSSVMLLYMNVWAGGGFVDQIIEHGMYVSVVGDKS